MTSALRRDGVHPLRTLVVLTDRLAPFNPPNYTWCAAGRPRFTTAKSASHGNNPANRFSHGQNCSELRRAMETDMGFPRLINVWKQSRCNPE